MLDWNWHHRHGKGGQRLVGLAIRPSGSSPAPGVPSLKRSDVSREVHGPVDVGGELGLPSPVVSLDVEGREKLADAHRGRTDDPTFHATQPEHIRHFLYPDTVAPNRPAVFTTLCGLLAEAASEPIGRSVSRKTSDAGGRSAMRGPGGPV